MIVCYTDRDGNYKQVSRTVYRKDEAALLDEYTKSRPAARLTVGELSEEYLRVKKTEVCTTTWDKTQRSLALYILPLSVPSG